MQRILVEVPVGRPFNCPECGGRLRPPVADGMQRPWVLPALRFVILLAGVGLGTGLGYMMGRVQPAVKKAVTTVSQDTVDKVNAARAMLGLPKVAADAIKMAPLAPAAPQSGPAPLTAAVPPLLVVERPYPRKAPPLEIEDPPPHLADEEHFGQVVIDCTLGAIQVKPACRISNVRGADAFSAAAIAWLDGLSVQYGPGTRRGAPSLLDHRWRVYIEDFSGTATTETPKPAARR